MSKSYEPGFGVLALPWQCGAPDTDGIVLVEVWYASTNLHSYEARKPKVRVHARIEIRRNTLGEPQRLHWGGTWENVKDPGEVRRWSRLPMANWSATIALDGWDR